MIEKLFAFLMLYINAAAAFITLYLAFHVWWPLGVFTPAFIALCGLWIALINDEL